VLAREQGRSFDHAYSANTRPTSLIKRFICPTPWWPMFTTRWRRRTTGGALRVDDGMARAHF
jgi:hypothetical protein